MEIKAVKYRKNGFMNEPFAFGIARDANNLKQNLTRLKAMLRLKK